MNYETENYEAIVYALSNEIIRLTTALNNYKEYAVALNEQLDLQKKELQKYRPEQVDIQPETETAE